MSLIYLLDRLDTAYLSNCPCGLSALLAALCVAGKSATFMLMSNMDQEILGGPRNFQRCANIIIYIFVVVRFMIVILPIVWCGNQKSTPLMLMINVDQGLLGGPEKLSKLLKS